MMPLMVMLVVIMVIVVEAPLTGARASVLQRGCTPLYFYQIILKIP